MGRFIDIEDALNIANNAVDETIYGESPDDVYVCLKSDLERCPEPAGMISELGLTDWGGKSNTKALCLVRLINGGYKISYYNNIKYIEGACEYWIIEEDL